MKFNHVVKHNGTLYPVGADVPVKGGRKKSDGKAGEPTEKQKDNASGDGDDATPPENDKSPKQEKSGK